MTSPSAVADAVARFFLPGAIHAIRPYGGGKVNATYLVTVSSPEEANYLLQRLSVRVFPYPERVMANLQAVCEHAAAQSLAIPGRRWVVPKLRRTLTGDGYWPDRSGDCWRVLEFIGATRCCEEVDGVEMAREVGFALGHFHRLLSGIEPGRLAVTLPGFHVAPRYLAHYDRVVASRRLPETEESRFCRSFIEERRQVVPRLEEAAAREHVTRGVIHGDPKVSNILFDEADGRAVSLIDLDTVGPGLLLIDIADCLRSSCNRAGEEVDASAVHFDLKLCRSLLQGYVDEAGSLLAAGDFTHLFTAVRLIALELGLRFYCDFLEGDIYFRINRPGHNLQRALAQFHLVKSIEQQKSDFSHLVRALQ